MKALPHVLIDLPATIVTDRQLLMGVLRYVHLHGPWFTQIVGYDAHLSFRNALNYRQFDGAIVDLENATTTRIIEQLGIPVVAISSDLSDIPRFNSSGLRVDVCSDNLGVGRAAAEYLLAQGFRNFAFIGIDTVWSRNRRTAFGETLAKHRQSCLSYELPATGRGPRQLAQLRRWLVSLPKPTALFVANDPLARQVNNVALQVGVAMPEELSILGVDNDPVFCESTTPPISSIRMNTNECGYNAAGILMQMIRGQPSKAPLIYGFAGVEERISTSLSHHKDPLVAAVSRTLNDRILRGMDPAISIPALSQAVNASPRLLQMRFKAETGRTLHEEITRLRFERAQALLKRNDFAISEIAHECGFATASHFATAFKGTFGLTPLAYRKG